MLKLVRTRPLINRRMFDRVIARLRSAFYRGKNEEKEREKKKKKKKKKRKEKRNNRQVPFAKNTVQTCA